MTCQMDHRYNTIFINLPNDQGGAGRHKCCGCAYDAGVRDGLSRKEILNIDLDNLPESQAGTVRHQSPHAAYALGYYEGIRQSNL